MAQHTDDLILDDPGQDSGPDIGQLLVFGIGRFRYWVALFVVLGGLGGLAAALMKPNQFSSEVKVLVHPGIRMLRSPDSILDANQTAGGSGTVVFDEVHLLSNPELAERVVARVGASFILQPYDPSTLDSNKTSWMMRQLHVLQASWSSRSDASVADDSPLAQQAAAEMVVKNLRLVTARGTNVIAIYYTAHSPTIAKTVAGAFLEVALERHGEVFASEKDLKTVTDKYEQALEKARSANQAFSDHKDLCGIVDFDVQREESVRVIQQQRALIDQDKIQLESIKGELALLDERLKNMNSEVVGDRPTVAIPMRNPAFDQLQLRKLTLEGQRDSLSGRFVETSDFYIAEHEFFTSQIEEIGETLETIEEFLPLVTIGGGVANPVYAQTVASRLTREQQQRFLLSGLDSRQTLLRRYEAHLADVMSCELAHRNHLVAIARSERDAGTLADIYTRESTLASIDQSASLKVFQSAILPTEKDGPQRLQTLLLGLALGLFGGLAFAVLRQLADSKLTYPAEVETVLGIPVLGLVPESRGWRRLGRKLGRGLATDRKNPTPEPA